MSQNNSIQTAVDSTTENYNVFESADEETIVGMYVSNGAVEALGTEFVTVTVGEGEVEADLQKTTTNYGVYATEGGAINGMYVARDVLAELADSDEEDEDALVPESIALTLSPSDEETFEEAVAAESGADEEEEAALVSGDSDSDEEDEEDEEEVEIADEEVGLVE